MTGVAGPLIAVVALVVAAHLGLGGAALAASRWTDWTAIAVMAVFLLKVVGLRLLAIRRGKVSHAPRNVLGSMFRNHAGRQNQSDVAASTEGSHNSSRP
jgi:hypothetical protein